MVDLAYVKKKKKKKIAIFVSSISAVVLTSFIIVAFLGQRVGAFTVSMTQNDNAKIALCEKSDFKDATSYLRVTSIPLIDVCTDSDITNHDIVDNENTSPFVGGEPDGQGGIAYLHYFKYTFFLKNIGTVPVRYTFNLNVLENTRPTNVDYSLLDIMRVRFYQNVDTASHSFETYAKGRANPVKDPEGKYEYRTPISEDNPKLAEMFASEEVIFSLNSKTNLDVNDMVRFTICWWLEGTDEQAWGVRPDKCSTKLGVSIAAYETSKNSQ